MFQSLTRSKLLVDIALGAALIAVRFTYGINGVLLGVVVAMMGVALALRRVSPLLSLCVAWAGAILQLAAGALPDVANLAILAVLFATARYGRGAVRSLGLASAAAGAVIATFYLVVVTAGTGEGLSGLLGYLTIPSTLVSLGTVGASIFAVLGLSWASGLLVAMRVRAQQLRLEQVRVEETVAVEQERNRIARDMHDVVAHSLAVVIAQADGARYTRASDPEAVDEALLTIATTAREALTDVRLLLGQLRHRQDAGPEPTIADLDQLLQQLRSSGMRLQFEQRGAQPATSPGQQIALYRIVQEALTNALRHGVSSETVEVIIVWTPAGGDLTITNAVNTWQAHDTATTPGHGGHGLAGMRERAELAGGTLNTLRDGDRFLVHATIPVAVTV